jgi:hypothetical protein
MNDELSRRHSRVKRPALRGSRMTAMKELAIDIAVVIGPAGAVYYLIGDQWVAVLWSIVGLSVRWYQRHWRHPPYSNSDQ